MMFTTWLGPQGGPLGESKGEANSKYWYFGPLWLLILSLLLKLVLNITSIFKWHFLKQIHFRSNIFFYIIFYLLFSCFYCFFANMFCFFLLLLAYTAPILPVATWKRERISRTNFRRWVRIYNQKLHETPQVPHLGSLKMPKNINL